jgi:hypothetical protein
MAASVKCPAGGRQGHWNGVSVNLRRHRASGVEDAMLELLEQQKRLTTNQKKIVAAAVIGDMLDYFDFGLKAYCFASGEINIW